MCRGLRVGISRHGNMAIPNLVFPSLTGCRVSRESDGGSTRPHWAGRTSAARSKGRDEKRIPGKTPSSQCLRERPSAPQLAVEGFPGYGKRCSKRSGVEVSSVETREAFAPTGTARSRNGIFFAQRGQSRYARMQRLRPQWRSHVRCGPRSLIPAGVAEKGGGGSSEAGISPILIGSTGA